jgi:hypothetical protein
MKGPYRIRIRSDGTTALLQGREATQADTGKWAVHEDQFCRTWAKTRPSPLCLAVVSDGPRVQLFDRTGLMFIDARLVDD